MRRRYAREVGDELTVEQAITDLSLRMVAVRVAAFGGDGWVVPACEEDWYIARVAVVLAELDRLKAENRRLNRAPEMRHSDTDMRINPHADPFGESEK